MLIYRVLLISFFLQVSQVAVASAGFQSQAPLTNVTEISNYLRPAVMIGDENDGVPVFTEFAVTRYFKKHVFFTYRAAPANIAFGNDGFNVFLLSAVEAGYNGRWMGIGAGLGIDSATSS